MASDLRPGEIVTVHHSKFALAKHPWDEPLETEKELAEKYGFNVKAPRIGEVVYLEMNKQDYKANEGI